MDLRNKKYPSPLGSLSLFHPLDAGFFNRSHNIFKQVQLLSHTLRQSTRHPHSVLEGTAVMRWLMAPGLTLGQYALVLQSWHRYWAPLEQAVEEFRPPCVPLLYRPQARVALLAADLAALAPWQPQLPGTVPPLEFDARGPRWYGLAYVLQGSLLGSSVIARHLRQTSVAQLHEAQGAGMGFFAFQEPAHSPLAQRWHEWLCWLDLSVTQPEAKRLATQAALQTFEAITRNLQSHEPHCEARP